jgi:thiosulfate dehydrogenase [quinone] large subunit
MIIYKRYHRIGVALLRVVVGIVFLWAGLEKAIGVGLGTWSAAGFLEFATCGSLGWPFVSEVAEGQCFNPTQGLWVGLAGNEAAMTLIDWLVPLGQIGIGVSLVLGLLTRFGAAMGTLMMLFFFVAAWDFQYGVVNQHLTYALICATIAGLGAGKYYGIDGILAEQIGPGFVRRYLMSGDPATPEGVIPTSSAAPATPAA